jgi:hypothetical protein
VPGCKHNPPTSHQNTDTGTTTHSSLSFVFVIRLSSSHLPSDP